MGAGGAPERRACTAVRGFRRTHRESRLPTSCRHGAACKFACRLDSFVDRFDAEESGLRHGAIWPRGVSLVAFFLYTICSVIRGLFTSLRLVYRRGVERRGFLCHRRQSWRVSGASAGPCVIAGSPGVFPDAFDPLRLPVLSRPAQLRTSRCSCAHDRASPPWAIAAARRGIMGASAYRITPRQRFPDAPCCLREPHSDRSVVARGN
jgi:hypothetical protein